jgi:hypothetical protein
MGGIVDTAALAHQSSTAADGACKVVIKEY